MSTQESRVAKIEKDHTSRAPGTAIPPDPVAFARLLNIEPDPWQRDLLTSSHERVILNCSRQSGKSTVVAILALHHALTTPGAVVLIVSLSLRQSELLFDKISTFYRQLGRPGGSDADSAIALRLRNGSRIVALPGSSEPTIRGFTPSLVLIDEAAWVSDEMYYTVTPMLAVSRGRLILLSTPHGKQGIFWRAWEHEPDWMKVKVTAEQCPRITKEWLDQQRRSLPREWFDQEFCCEFVQEGSCTFKESWVQFYDPEYAPDMNAIIQSWDTAQTKSTSSHYVVGQVWGRIGADFYLLDQKRGRWDFDETVAAMKTMTEEWPNSSAKLIEAQTLGAALASHLKHEIPGLIPIQVTSSKELRARNCVPLWRSKNVYIPKPDDGEYAWVYEYVRELTSFPNAEHDDQVDATTLALNRLQGSLYPDSKSCAVEESTLCTQPQPGHDYWVCWIPARQKDNCTVLVYDMNTHDVVSFRRFEADPIAQLTKVCAAAKIYNGAGVRAFSGMNDALLLALETKGVFVERVTLNKAQMAAAYENLSMIMRELLITIPNHYELLAELDVFTSEFTWDESPLYSSQIAQQSAIHALVLATYDVTPEEIKYPHGIWYSYDPRQV